MTSAQIENRAWHRQQRVQIKSGLARWLRRLCIPALDHLPEPLRQHMPAGGAQRPLPGIAAHQHQEQVFLKCGIIDRPRKNARSRRRLAELCDFRRGSRNGKVVEQPVRLRQGQHRAALGRCRTA